MIIEGLIDIVFWFVELFFDGLQFFRLPDGVLTLLYNFMAGGVWIIGVDCFSAIMASVIFWLTFKAGAGLILFIWRLLPLT